MSERNCPSCGVGCLACFNAGRTHTAPLGSEPRKLTASALLEIAASYMGGDWRLLPDKQPVKITARVYSGHFTNTCTIGDLRAALAAAPGSRDAQWCPGCGVRGTYVFEHHLDCSTADVQPVQRPAPGSEEPAPQDDRTSQLDTSLAGAGFGHSAARSGTEEPRPVTPGGHHG